MIWNCFFLFRSCLAAGDDKKAKRFVFSWKIFLVAWLIVIDWIFLISTILIAHQAVNRNLIRVKQRRKYFIWFNDLYNRTDIRKIGKKRNKKNIPVPVFEFLSCDFFTIHYISVGRSIYPFKYEISYLFCFSFVFTIHNQYECFKGSSWVSPMKSAFLEWTNLLIHY